MFSVCSETGDNPDERASALMERKKTETVEQARARLVRELKDYFRFKLRRCHTALHAVGASVPECSRLTRRNAAEARWAYRASNLTLAPDVNCVSGFPPRRTRHVAPATR